MRSIRRRAFLRAAVGGVASAALPHAVLAADPLAVSRVTDALTLIEGAGGNVLVSTAPEGQLLVDSGAPQSSAALLDALRSLPGADRVHTLINTHWHTDQTGANAALGGSGAHIVAHEKTRLRLSTDTYVPEGDRYEPALPPEARPAEGFYTETAVTAGGEEIRCGYLLEAHTDGDIYVQFTAGNVIAVGDAVSPARDPVLDWFGGGWLGGRVDALAKLLAISDTGTRFVPSYGPVVSRAAVQAEHDVMLMIFERMVELVRKGMSAEDVLAAGALEGTREWQEPLKFVRAAHKGLWAHHNTLSPDIV